VKAIILLSSFFAASISLADCLPNTLCAGDRVMDSSNRLALVLEVSDQAAKIKLDDRTFPVTRSITSLAKKTKCYQNVCADDRVLDGAEQMGVVTNVFDNGKAQVKFDNGTVDIRIAVTLGKSVQCIDKICVEQNIKDLGGNPGIILELFDSGKALVRFDHSVFPRVRTFLSLNIQANCKIRENCFVTTPVQVPKQPQQQRPPPLGRRGGK
jgi:preprotein translocase subunit YajC